MGYCEFWQKYYVGNPDPRRSMHIFIIYVSGVQISRLSEAHRSITLLSSKVMFMIQSLEKHEGFSQASSHGESG